LFLGLPSVFLDPDTKRRGIYGNLSDHRPKPYGGEYRVMGTGMMNFIPEIKKGLQLINSVIDADKVNDLKTEYWSTLLALDSEIKTVSKIRVRSLYNNILSKVQKIKA
jgi:hypothetical protein